jgi:hypothetical protein
MMADEMTFERWERERFAALGTGAGRKPWSPARCRPCSIVANVIYLIAISASGVLGCQAEDPDFDCEFGSLIFNRTALPRSVLGLRRDK